VVCTGRSTRTARSEYDRPETIEETAELVTALGGVGVAVPADHLVPSEVEALAARLRAEHGHIDVLVNDIWGGETLKEWDAPVWEHSLENGLHLLRLAVETHLVTAHHLFPLLLDSPVAAGGLHVEVTDGTASYNETRYRLCAFYDLAKVAVNRLAFSFGHELGSRGATAVALTPGWLRSEIMLETFQVTEENWRDSFTSTPPTGPADFALSESPRFVGRAVVALATDPGRARWNQRSIDSGSLAREYGFTDLDGSQPDVWKFLVEVREAGLDADPDDYR
jgi:NAD(P)-dependent dehydrogenase (short-subunit alcohol dehydrogenase family)